MINQTDKDYETIGKFDVYAEKLGTICYGDSIVSKIVSPEDGSVVIFSHDAEWNNYYVEDVSILEHLDK